MAFAGQTEYLNISRMIWKGLLKPDQGKMTTSYLADLRANKG